MPATSMSHMIFFIVALLLASSVSSVMVMNVGRITDSFNEKTKVFAGELITDIKIINDPYITNNKFYVKNTGRSKIFIPDINLIIDGICIENFTVTNLNNKQYDKQHKIIESGSHFSDIGDVMLIKTKSAPVYRGYHTVKVVLGNGISDTLKYVI